MNFSALAVKLGVRLVKQVSKIEVVVDKIQSQFKNGCPTPQEIAKIVKRKNAIDTALGRILKLLKPIEKPIKVVKPILRVLKIALKIALIIPIPTPAAVPYALGVGDVVIKQGLGAIKTIEVMIDIIIGILEGVRAKLALLDTSILNCISELLDEQSSNQGTGTGGDGTGGIGNGTGGTGDGTGADSDGTGDGNGSGLTREQLAQQIGLSLTDISDAISNPTKSGDDEIISISDGNGGNLTFNSSEDLLNSLSSNSTNPLLYRGFRFIIENDPKNQLKFPARRVKVVEINSKKPIILYNLKDQGYSYSSSFEVLVSEAQFRVDQFLDI